MLVLVIVYHPSLRCVLVNQRSLSPSVKPISSLLCSVVIPGSYTVANLGLMGARRLNTPNIVQSPFRV